MQVWRCTFVFWVFGTSTQWAASRKAPKKHLKSTMSATPRLKLLPCGSLMKVRTLIVVAILGNLNLNLHIALQKQKLLVETSWLAACLDEGPAPASSMPVGWPPSFQFQLHPLLHCQSFQAGFNSLIPSLPVPAPILSVAPLPPHLRRSAVFPDMKIRCVLQLNPQKAVY